MKDIFDLIKNNKKTFEDFRKWLFIKLNKNTNNFVSFGKYSNRVKLPYLLEFLEDKGVSILDAMNYYYWKGCSHIMTHEELSMYVIIEEFKRIELNITIDYVPF